MKTLSEQYFKEVLGFDSAGRLGRGIGAQFTDSGKKIRDKAKEYARLNPGQTVNQSVKGLMSNPDNVALAKKAGSSTAANIGSTAGKVALGGAYIGAAYLAYKGLMKLKDRFSKSNNPQEKENLQKQIDQGQAKLKRVKELQKVRKKQDAQKRKNI